MMHFEIYVFSRSRSPSVVSNSSDTSSQRDRQRKIDTFQRNRAAKNIQKNWRKHHHEQEEEEVRFLEFCVLCSMQGQYLIRHFCDRFVCSFKNISFVIFTNNTFT